MKQVDIVCITKEIVQRRSRWVMTYNFYDGTGKCYTNGAISLDFKWMKPCNQADIKEWCLMKRRKKDDRWTIDVLDTTGECVREVITIHDCVIEAAKIQALETMLLVERNK